MSSADEFLPCYRKINNMDLERVAIRKLHRWWLFPHSVPCQALPAEIWFQIQNVPILMRPPVWLGVRPQLLIYTPKCTRCSHWRRFLLEEGGWRRDRDAEGVEGEWGGAVPLPSRLGDLGERRKLPQRGPGRGPGQKRVLVHSELERTHVVTTNLVGLFLAGGRPTWMGVYSICYTPTLFQGGCIPSIPQDLRPWL